jgi:hypothetical protein
MTLLMRCGVLLCVGVVLPAATWELTVTPGRLPPPVVIVWAEGLDDWATATATETKVGVVHVTQRNRTFIPGWAVAPPGGAVHIDNEDDQRHNVFALDPALRIDTDLGLGEPGTTMVFPVTWAAGQVLRAGCKIHPAMRLWIASVPTRHHLAMAWPKVEGKDAPQASLTLTEVPASVSHFRVWTPRIDAASVVANSSVELRWKDAPAGSIRAERRE